MGCAHNDWSGNELRSLAAHKLNSLLRRLGLRNFINFRGKNEVALGEPIDLVRPDGYRNIAPTQKNVGMMALFLGDCSYCLHKLETADEVGKAIALRDVVLIYDLPVLHLPSQRGQLFAFEWRNSALARHACKLCEFSHGSAI